MKIPGPDHPITVEPAEARVQVTFAGQVIADSTSALRLREGSYPPVYYVPQEDVVMSHLERSTHGTHCPHKGDASYYSIAVGDERSQDAVWVYETPFDAVRPITGHLAFYESRVDSIEIV